MGERLMHDGTGVLLLTEEQATEVFQQLVGDYGMGAVRAKWESLTPNQVKANIAKRLGKFTWGAIRRALDMAPNRFPEFPPNTGQLVALCESCEPVKPMKALPAPVMTAEEIQARQAEAQAIAAKIAANVPSKVWAQRLRKRYLAGERLLMVQVSMASDALGETWADEDGKRECRERRESATA